MARLGFGLSHGFILYLGGGGGGGVAVVGLLLHFIQSKAVVPSNFTPYGSIRSSVSLMTALRR